MGKTEVAMAIPFGSADMSLNRIGQLGPCGVIETTSSLSEAELDGIQASFYKRHAGCRGGGYVDKPKNTTDDPMDILKVPGSIEGQ